MREKELLVYNLRRLRKLNRYSQKNIANELNISRTTYMDYENGTTDIKAYFIYRLCKLYKCSADEFFRTI